MRLTFQKIIGVIFPALVVGVLCLAGPSELFAVPGGMDIEWDGNGGGRVIFSGAVHAAAGKKCNDCHPKLFLMKKHSTKITMRGLFSSQACGGCHNGKDAFDGRKFENCKRCHLKD